MSYEKHVQTLRALEKRIEGEFGRLELGFASAADFRRKVRELGVSLEPASYVELVQQVEAGASIPWPRVLKALYSEPPAPPAPVVAEPVVVSVAATPAVVDSAPPAAAAAPVVASNEQQPPQQQQQQHHQHQAEVPSSSTDILPLHHTPSLETSRSGTKLNAYSDTDVITWTKEPELERERHEVQAPQAHPLPDNLVGASYHSAIRALLNDEINVPTFHSWLRHAKLEPSAHLNLLLARLCSGERVTFVELCRETSALRPVSAPTAAKEVVQAAHHTSHSGVIFDWDSQPKVAPEPLSEGGKGLHSVGGYTADGQAERDVIAWTKTKGDEDQQSKVSNATVIPSSSAHDLLVWNDTSKPAVDEIKVTPAKADSRQQTSSMDIFAWGDTAPVTPEKRRPAPPAAAAAATAAAAPSTVPAADSYAVKRLNRYDSPAPWGVEGEDERAINPHRLR